MTAPFLRLGRVEGGEDGLDGDAALADQLAAVGGGRRRRRARQVFSKTSRAAEVPAEAPPASEMSSSEEVRRRALEDRQLGHIAPTSAISSPATEPSSPLAMRRGRGSGSGRARPGRPGAAPPRRWLAARPLGQHVIDRSIHSGRRRSSRVPFPFAQDSSIARTLARVRSLYRLGLRRPAPPIDDQSEERMTEPLSTDEAVSSTATRFLIEDAPDGPFPPPHVSLDGDALVARNWRWRRPNATWRPSSPPGWSGGAAPDRRTSIETSSTTPSTRSRPRSSSAASACSRLYHAPGETTGARTQGPRRRSCSRALAEVEWKQRREAAGKPVGQANLILLAATVHVVWGQVLPLLRRRAEDRAAAGRQVHDRPEDVEPLIDENTIGVAAVLGTTFTGHADDIRHQQAPGRSQEREGNGRAAAHRRRQRRLRLAFLYPDSEWDFPARAGALDQRLRHKFGLVYPGIGWLVFREKTNLA